jgi:hypothetical protein
MIKKISGFLIGSMLLFYGCYNNKEELLYGPVCEGPTPSFETDVNTIIQSSCAATCHSARSTAGPGPLTTYSQIKNAAERIKAAVVSGSMPKNGSLTREQIRAISCWVDGGAPNN